MPALREEAIVPGNLKAWMELCAWLLLAAGATLLATLGILSEEGCIWVATILLLGIFLAAWRGFEGGRHPCFLFLGMLLVFQCGRLIAHILGALPNPMQIEAAASVPIGISTDAAEVTLLMLVLSAICVYAPCRLAYRAIIFGAGNEDRWLPALYLLILLTFPLAFYKNWAYFSYIRAHGGYLAVFTDNAGILQSAGTFIRSIALVNNAALLTAFVFERRPRRIFWILMLYFALSTLDLLIGFRGKFFSQALVLWFIQKLKAGGRFKLVPLLVLAAVVCAVALAVAGFRQDHSIQMLSPIAFLGQQGVSLNVTEAAVAFHDTFARFGFNYLWGGFVYGIVPPPAGVQHHMWTNDLEDFLNPVAAQLGYGTASTYLAELFLLGGISSVMLGSLLVGLTLQGLHRTSRYAWGAVLAVFALPSLLYLPRLEFLGPVAALVRAAAGFIPAVAFAVFYRRLAPFLRLAPDRPMQQ